MIAAALATKRERQALRPSSVGCFAPISRPKSWFSEVAAGRRCCQSRLTAVLAAATWFGFRPRLAARWLSGTVAV